MKLPAPFRTALPFALATGLLAPALTQTEAQAGPDARAYTCGE